MSVRVRNYDETKCFSLLIEDAEFLKKYNNILDKVSNIIKKRFNS